VNRASLETALAEYVSALSKSEGTTSRSEDRVTYQRHLASAAVMFAAIHQGDVLRLKEIVDGERPSVVIAPASSKSIPTFSVPAA